VSGETRYFRLGLFLLLGLVLAVAVILVLGAGELFRAQTLAETYMNQSVQGLDTGSAVKFRGVKVGEVKRIGFTSSIYEQDQPIDQRKGYVYVLMALYPDAFGTRQLPTAEVIRTLVERGLRFRMSMAGITGVGYLELDFVDPAQNPPLALGWQPRHLYVPSAPSTVTQMLRNAQDFLGKLDRIDFESLVRNLNVLVSDIDRAVNDIEMKKLAGDASATIAATRQAIDRIDGILRSPGVQTSIENVAAATGRLRKLLEEPALDGAPKDAAQALAALRAFAESGELQRTLDDMQRLLRSVEGLVDANQPALAASLENVREITDNLRELTAWVKSYPAGALLSEPPKPVLPTR
jgi:paraquat-inducible protein B